MALCVIELLFAGAAIDGEQRIDAGQQARGSLVLGVQLQGVGELSSRMAVTSLDTDSKRALDLLARGPCGSRRPRCHQACHTARDRPDGWCRCNRVSAP